MVRFFLIHFIQGNINFFSFHSLFCDMSGFFLLFRTFLEHFFSSHFYSYFVKHILNIEKNMPFDYKYIFFNIKNDKLSIFCILTHRYGKHRKSQSMKDLWTLVICHLFTLMS